MFYHLISCVIFVASHLVQALLVFCCSFLITTITSSQALLRSAPHPLSSSARQAGALLVGCILCPGEQEKACCLFEWLAWNVERIQILTHTHILTLFINTHADSLASHISSHPSTTSTIQDLLLTLLACSPTSPGVPAHYCVDGPLPRAWFDANVPLRHAVLRGLCAGPAAVVMQVRFLLMYRDRECACSVYMV